MRSRRACQVGLVAGLLTLLPATADARGTARFLALKAPAGVQPGAALSITPKILVAGGRTRVTLTGKLVGARTYRLKAVVSAPLTGARVLPYAPVVPKNAKVGVYQLTVCVTPAKPKLRCRVRAAKVRVVAGPLKPKPLNVQRSVDAAHAVTATIGPEGGTVSTTTDDGTRARLTIPAKALTIATEITMTPVTGLTGHPANPAVAAGVQLSPDGLEFDVPATLELIPTVQTKAIQRTVLTSDAGGTNTRPELFRDVGSGARVQILHFSSYELAYVPARDLAAQRRMLDASKFPPSQNIEQLTSRLAEKLGAERLVQLEKTKDAKLPEDHSENVHQLGLETQAEIYALIDAYYSGQVLPQLEQAKATASCEITPLALTGANAWRRLVGLLGLEKDYAVQFEVIHNLEVELIKNGLTCLHKRCVQDNYPEAFEDYQRLLAVADFNGVTPPYTLQEEARRCLRFKVEMESDLTIPAGANPLGGIRSGPGYTYILRGEGAVPETGFGDPIPPFPVVLTYDVFTGGTADFYPGQVLFCTDARLTEDAAGGNPGAVNVNLGTLTVRHSAALTEQKFVMKIDAGDTYDSPQEFGGPYETYFNNGGCVPDPNNTYENRWARVFDFVGTRDTRTNAPDAPSRPYQLAGFTRGTNPVYLQRTKRDLGNVGGWDFDITTTIRIVHTPIRVG